jgi:site-specific DNA-methyltransferase (adenine-specific)
MSRAGNVLALGDAADVCAALPGEVRFDLVYLDPPFGLGTTMAARAGLGQARGRKHAQSGPDAYEDPAGAGALMEMLAPRLAAIRDHMAGSCSAIGCSAAPRSWAR